MAPALSQSTAAEPGASPQAKPTAPDESASTSEHFREKHREAELFPVDEDQRTDKNVRVGTQDILAALKASDDSKETNESAIDAREKLVLQLAYMRKQDNRKNILRRVVEEWKKLRGDAPLPEFLREALEIQGRGIDARWNAWRAKWVANELDSAESKRREQPLTIMKRRNALMEIFSENPPSDAEIKGDREARRARLKKIERALQETLGTSERAVLARLLEDKESASAFSALMRWMDVAKGNLDAGNTKAVKDNYNALTSWDFGMRDSNGGINETHALEMLSEMRAESEMQSQRNVSLTQNEGRESDIAEGVVGKATKDADSPVFDTNKRMASGIESGELLESTSDADSERETGRAQISNEENAVDISENVADTSYEDESLADIGERGELIRIATAIRSLRRRDDARTTTIQKQIADLELEAQKINNLRGIAQRNAVEDSKDTSPPVNAPQTTDISKVAVAKAGTRESRKIRAVLTSNPAAVQEALVKMRALLGTTSPKPSGFELSNSSEHINARLAEAMDRPVMAGGAMDPDIQRIFFNPRSGARGVFDRSLMRALADTSGDSTLVVVLSTADWKKALGKDASRIDGLAISDPDSIVETGTSGIIFMPERMLNPKNAALTHEIFMHEMVHVATEFTIWRDAKTRGEVRAMMNTVEDWLDNHEDQSLANEIRSDPSVEYALSNEAEFVAMAMSNRVFQTLLENIQLGPADRARLKLTGQAPTLFAKFVDMVRSLLNLGPRTMTMLEGVIEVVGSRFATGEQNRALAAQVLSLSPEQETYAHALMNFGNMGSAVAKLSSDRSTNFLDRLKSWGPALSTMRQLEYLTGEWWSRTEVMDAFDPSERSSPVKVVSRAILSQSQQAEDILTKEFNPTLSKLNDRPDASQQAIAGLAVDSSMANIHPDEDLQHPKNAHILKSTADTARQARARHKDLHTRFKALSEEDQDLFIEIGEMTRKGHKNLIRSIIDMTLDRWFDLRAQQSVDPKNPVTMPMSRADYNAMKERFLDGKESNADQKMLDEDTYTLIEVARERGKLEGYYVPLRRHGQFAVRWQTRDNPVLEFDTAQELNDAVANAPENVQPGSRRRITYDAKGDEVTAADPLILQAETQAALFRLPMTASQADKDAALKAAAKDALDRTKEDAIKAGGKLRYRAVLVTQGLAFHDTIAGAQNQYESLKAASVPGLRQIDLRDNTVTMTGLIEPEIERMLRKVMRDDAMSDSQRAATMNALQKALLVLTPNRAVQASQIKRKGAQGASRDIGRFLSEYATANANYVAANFHQHQIQRGLGGMEQNVRDATTNDSTPKGRVVAMRRIVNELRLRAQRDALDNMMTGDGLLERIMRSIQSIAFLYYLVSPAYAMIQLLQPYLLSAPVLAGKYGARGVTELGKAMSDIGMGRVLRGGVKEAGRALKTFVDHKGVGQSADLFQIARANISQSRDGADLVRMLDELQLEGLVGNSSGLEVIRTLKAREGFMGTNLAKAEAFGRAIPGAIEVVNRTSTAVAAYRLSRKAGQTHEQATDYARVTVDQTQADYSAANTSRFMRPSNLALRAITSPMMTFRKYAQAVYALLGAQAYQALKGADKQTRKDARRVLMGIMAAHISMAGALGLPTEGIFIALGAIAFALGEDEPWDLETEARKMASDVLGPEAAELLMRGLPRALGVDLSSRVGLNALLFMKDLQDYQGRTFTGYMGDFILGAPGGIVQKWLSVPGQIANEEWGKAMEAALPKGIADVLKATRISEEGITTRRGERIDANREVPMTETLMQALGLTPAATAETYERRNAVQGASRRISTERNELLRKWRQAEPAERTRIWRENILPWNDGLPGELRSTRITMQNLQASLREATRRERESGGEDYLPRNRAALREEGRFAVIPR